MDKIKGALAFALAALMGLQLAACSDKDNNTIMDKVPDGKKGVDFYVQQFRRLNPELALKTYFPTLEDMQKVKDLAALDTKCTKHYVKDVDSILITIASNSANFIANNSEYRAAFKTSKPRVEQVLFEKIIREIMTKFLATATNDINEDIHSLSSLSIVFSEASDIGLGIYNAEENLIVLSSKALCDAASNENVDDYLYKLIGQAINVVRQNPCDCRVEQAQEAGVVLDGMWPFNENRFSFIQGGSAQSEIYTLGKIQEGTESEYYYSNRLANKDETSLLWLALFNPNAKIEDYYNALFDNDYGALHEFFGLKSDEDLLAFYQMIYAVDSYQVYNPLKSKYKEEIGEVTQANFSLPLENYWKVRLFAQILSRMAEYTTNTNDFTLRDNLALFHMIKNDVSILDAGTSYTSSFVDSLKEIEAQYKEFLSQSYGVSIDDITDLESSEEMRRYLEVFHPIILNFGFISPESENYELVTSLVKRLPLLETIIKLKQYVTLNDYGYDELPNKLVKEK
ncbi:MAG: hypothetical protein K2M17_02600 [Bacilli bacterium]|nr:hypothetical protein [Bacilli bacterium]